MMDTVGNKAAKTEIAMIKVAAPNMAAKLSIGRFRRTAAPALPTISACRLPTPRRDLLRIADGPDEVHRNQIAKFELAEHF